MLIIKPTYKRLPHEEYCDGYLDNHIHSLKFRIKRFNTDALLSRWKGVGHGLWYQVGISTK